MRLCARCGEWKKVGGYGVVWIVWADSWSLRNVMTSIRLAKLRHYRNKRAGEHRDMTRKVYYSICTYDIFAQEIERENMK